MKSQHRSLLAIGLSIGIIIAWYAFFSPNKPAVTQVAQDTAATTQAAATAPAAETTKAAPQAAATTDARPDPQSGIAAKETVLEDSRVRATFTNKGGVPTKWEVKGYHQSTEPKSPLVDLSTTAAPSMTLAFDDANFFFPTSPTYKLISATKDKVVYEWRSDEVAITKTIELGKIGYDADVRVRITNLTGKALTGKPQLAVGGTSAPRKKKGFFSFLQPPPADNATPLYFMDGSVEREKKIGDIGALQVVSPDQQKGGGMYWAGLENRYFLSVVIPRTMSSGLSAVIGSKPVEGDAPGTTKLMAGAVLAPVTVIPNGTADVSFTTYMGPKEIRDLKAIGVNLDEAIDFGWFTVIAVPILYALKFFYSILHNYGLAIILLTIIIKLMMHPINLKSLKSMKAMQELQPRLKELQKKYKGNKERLNQETMQLFKAHKVNPMGGCLPMLLQLPIYIALYKVLWNSIELYHAPFFWFYKDLSAPDPYMITPIILGVFMVAQQKLMPSASADPMQKKMMMIMPVMFTVFMVFLPVGLVVYILVNTVMTVVTQWMYNKGIRFRDIARFKFKAHTVAA